MAGTKGSPRKKKARSSHSPKHKGQKAKKRNHTTNMCSLTARIEYIKRRSEFEKVMKPMRHGTKEQKMQRAWNIIQSRKKTAQKAQKPPFNPNSVDAVPIRPETTIGLLENNQTPAQTLDNDASPAIQAQSKEIVMISSDDKPYVNPNDDSANRECSGDLDLSQIPLHNNLEGMSAAESLSSDSSDSEASFSGGEEETSQSADHGPLGESLPQEIATTRRKLPKGYAFVRKGNPYVTRKCREFTHNAHKPFYVVYKPSTRIQIGIGVPSEFYKRACDFASATKNSRKNAVAANDRRIHAAATGVIARLYPGMPASERNAAVRHGFEKRSGRVGRVGKLGDEDRARRVVTAYARHNKTKYEETLAQLTGKGLTTDEARKVARKKINRELSGVLKRWKR